jgi:putative (di)nucleoside polyphosphate hydrolase
VDEGESLEEALFRELKEELGLSAPQELLTITKKREETAKYIFPTKIITQYLNKGRRSYIGQEQTWFLLSFSGNDSDINLNFEGSDREFRSFLWGGTEHLSRVSYHKRKTYQKLFEEFSIL